MGVSTPLQLLAVGGPGTVCGVLEDGEEEVEGGESMVVVRTNESVLHERIIVVGILYSRYFITWNERLLQYCIVYNPTHEPSN